MDATPPPPHDASSLRYLLSTEHAQLEQLFDDLLAAAAANATDDAAKLWTQFDTRLRAHLELEEQHVLPAFGRAYPLEAGEILDDHTQIRSTLTKLGVGVDLHLTRTDMIDQFITLLRRHAMREDALMYEWSEAHLEPRARTHVLERMLAHLKAARAG